MLGGKDERWEDDSLKKKKKEKRMRAKNAKFFFSYKNKINNQTAWTCYKG